MINKSIEKSLHVMVSKNMGGVSKYQSKALRQSKAPSSPKRSVKIQWELTFSEFHHIFISHTYRTKKSSFFKFREKGEFSLNFLFFSPVQSVILKLIGLRVAF